MKGDPIERIDGALSLAPPSIGSLFVVGIIPFLPPTSLLSKEKTTLQGPDHRPLSKAIPSDSLAASPLQRALLFGIVPFSVVIEVHHFE